MKRGLSGDLNPARRPEVREKIRQSRLKGLQEGKIKIWNKGLKGEEYLNHFVNIGRPLIHRYKEINCSYCNKLIHRQENDMNKYKELFCNNKCKSEHYKITRKGDKHPMFGYKMSQESKEKNRLSHLGKIAWNKGLIGVHAGKNNPMYGKHQSENQKELDRKWHLGQKSSEETRKKQSITMKNVIENRPELREIWRQAGLNKYKNRPELKIIQGKIISKYMKEGRYSSRPTKPEQQLTQLFQQHNLPFKYVGNRTFWIDSFNPDFVDEQHKKIIEFDGKYWHSLPYMSIRDEKRNLAYLDAGYDVMLINESNINNEKQLIEDIKQFRSDE